MKFGHFDDLNKEYVINTPYTPYPWINYLGSDDYFVLMSNTSGGYSFYKDARDRRIDRKSTRLNSSHVRISYAVFCLKKKTKKHPEIMIFNSLEASPLQSPPSPAIDCPFQRTSHPMILRAASDPPLPSYTCNTLTYYS